VDQEIEELRGVRHRLERLIARRFLAPLTAQDEALYRELVEREARLLTLV
jgi:hypothetical protein